MEVIWYKSQCYTIHFFFPVYKTSNLILDSLKFCGASFHVRCWQKIPCFPSVVITYNQEEKEEKNKIGTFAYQLKRNNCAHNYSPFQLLSVGQVPQTDNSHESSNDQPIPMEIETKEDIFPTDDSKQEDPIVGEEVTSIIKEEEKCISFKAKKKEQKLMEGKKRHKAQLRKEARARRKKKQKKLMACEQESKRWICESNPIRIEKEVNQLTKKSELKWLFPPLPCSIPLNPHVLVALSNLIFPIFLLIGIHDTLQLIAKALPPSYQESVDPCSSFGKNVLERKAKECSDLEDIITVFTFSPSNFLPTFQSLWKKLEAAKWKLLNEFYRIRSILEMEKDSPTSILISFLSLLAEGVHELIHLSQENCLMLATETGYTTLKNLHEQVVEHLHQESWEMQQTIEFLFGTNGAPGCEEFCQCLEPYCASRIYSSWRSTEMKRGKIPIVCLSHEHQKITLKLLQHSERNSQNLDGKQRNKKESDFKKDG